MEVDDPKEAIYMPEIGMNCTLIALLLTATVDWTCMSTGF
jgi:hypothetical protein